jgi:hypothetical protein
MNDGTLMLDHGRVTGNTAEGLDGSGIFGGGVSTTIRSFWSSAGGNRHPLPGSRASRAALRITAAPGD